MTDSVRVDREIDASADVVWALVSDLPRMGEWSDENEGGKWLRGADGPAVGAAFRGANRNGFRRWSTRVVVTECAPGERFGFDVASFGIPVSAWTYEIEPTPTGCAIAETWHDRRPGFFKPISRLATGVSDRVAHTRAGMARTLDRIAAAAETPLR